jgi:hypothetical protein
VKNFEWILTPSKFNERSRPLALELDEWSEAVRLSKRFGYAPPESSGMTRDAVQCFARALRRAAADEAGEHGEWLAKLIAFLEGEARGGFTQSRQWRSWRRAAAGK